MEQQITIGIVGGGQLAKNLTLAAHPLGYKVIVVEPGDSCPAAQAGAEQISANLYDEAALMELARRSDYVTVEIEHLNAAALKKIAQKKLAKVRPSGQTIELIQDKLAQKKFFETKAVPLAPFEEVATKQDVIKLLDAWKQPVMLKTRFGAYNGLGNFLVKDHSQVDEAWNTLGGKNLYVEKIVNFTKELAVMAARDTHGNVVLHPVVETIHKNNICLETLAPAEVNAEINNKARKIATKVVTALDDIGIFGIEMFLTQDGQILINEVAPRVHNSGHYTLDGCLVSQFDQHLRAITDLPLGNTDLIVPAAVMINILGERNGPTKVKGLATALKTPQVYVHIYGKSPTKLERKMGHINAIGDTVKIAQTRARKARKLIDI